MIKKNIPFSEIPYKTQEKANEVAKEMSLKEKDKTYHIIKSFGEYYVDDKGIRSWEDLLCSYKNGIIV